MTILKHNEKYIPLTGEAKKLVFKLRKLHEKRARIYNHLAFLHRCLKHNITPKGMVVKINVISKRSLAGKIRFQKFLVKEHIRNLYSKRVVIQKEIFERTSSLITGFPPKNWLFIRDFILDSEKKVFLETRIRHLQKFNCLMQDANPLDSRNARSRCPPLPIINISDHVLTFPEQKLLGKGLKFIPTSSRINEKEVAVDVELTLQRYKIQDTTIPNIVREVLVRKENQKDNLKKEERRAIASIFNNKDIIITSSDKGNNTVVMNKQDYEDKLKAIVESEDYEALYEDPNKRIDADLRKQVGLIKNSRYKLRDAFSKIVSHAYRNPAIFGLPKTHKEGIPLRPIISCYGTVLEKVAKFINPILNDLLEMRERKDIVRTRILNIPDLKNKIADITYPLGSRLFSLDVIKMFPSVPTDEVLECISRTMSEYKDFEKIWCLPRNVFFNLVEIILNNSFFLYKGTFYRQQRGLPMGSSVSPAAANIFMQNLESNIKKVKNFEYIQTLSRYVDDYFGVWSGSLEVWNQFLVDINSLHPTVKFTAELDVEGTLNYLDASITLIRDSLHFEMYTKPSSSPALLPGDGFLDLRTLKSVIVGETTRILKISENLEKDIGNLVDRLKINRYPSNLIHSTIGGCVNSFLKKNHRNEENKDSVSDGAEQEAKEDPMRLPLTYMGAKSRTLNKLLRNLKISVAHKQCRSLGNIFSKGFKYPTFNRKGLIYKISCSCGSFYIGETGFDLKKRIYEHKRSVANKQDSNALALHARKHPDHSIEWEEAETLEYCSDPARRKITEALWIRNLKPPLNTSGGVLLRGTWII